MLRKKLAIIISGVFLVTSFSLGFGLISSNYSAYAKSKGKDKGKQSKITADALTSATQKVTTTTAITTTAAITTTPSSISTTPAGIKYTQHKGKGNGAEKGKGKSNGNGKDGAPKLKGKDRANYVHKRNDERKAFKGYGNGNVKEKMKEKDKEKDNTDNTDEIDD